MVREKNIALCIVLSVITCGLYGMYWMVCLADDVNAVSNEYGTSGPVVLLLTIVTCGLYGWYWLYKSGEKIDRMKTQRGENAGYLAIVYMLLGIFGLGIISYALMQSEINRCA